MIKLTASLARKIEEDPALALELDMLRAAGIALAARGVSLHDMFSVLNAALDDEPPAQAPRQAAPAE